MTERTRFQQKVIRNYYNNRGDIALQRVQELVTELYLAEGKKREQHWKSIVGHLQALGVKQNRIDQLIKSNDPTKVAELVAELVSKAG